MSEIDKLRAMERGATPGPWEVEREELDARYFCDEEQEMAMPDRVGPLLLSDVDGTDAQIEANVRLIAALRNCAPELLAVAEAALSLGGGVNTPPERWKTMDRARAALRAAIRRATEATS